MIKMKSAAKSPLTKEKASGDKQKRKNSKNDQTRAEISHFPPKLRPFSLIFADILSWSNVWQNQKSLFSHAWVSDTSAKKPMVLKPSNRIEQISTFDQNVGT